MQSQESEGQGITPEQGWNSIQATLDRSRSSMYMAGLTTIMIMWGAIIAVANLSQIRSGNMGARICVGLPVVPRPVVEHSGRHWHGGELSHRLPRKQTQRQSGPQPRQRG